MFMHQNFFRPVSDVELSCAEPNVNKLEQGV